MSTLTLDQAGTATETVPPPRISYQLQWRRCGRRQTCRCHTDREARHGPYWYAYWRDPLTKKLRSRYVGKKLVAIEVDQQQGEPRR